MIRHDAILPALFVVSLGMLACGGNDAAVSSAPKAPLRPEVDDDPRAHSSETGLPLVPWIELPSGLSVERKLDIGMAGSYREWLANPERSPDAGIAITLWHKGELGPIEALGFKTHSVSGKLVMGEVRFRDVPTLVAHDGVVQLAAGSRHVRSL